MSINTRELLAIESALEFFALLLQNSSVAVFADNSTAIAYLRNQEGTQSQLLNAIVQRILRWAESRQVTLAPQFIMGRHNVLADSLSCPNQVLGSEWTFKTEVFQELRKRCPLTIDLVATSLSPMFNIFFSVPRSERLCDRCSAPELEWVAGICLSTLVTHSSGSQEALVVVWSPPYHRSSVLASEAVVSRSSGSGCGLSDSSLSVSRSASSAPLSSTPSGGVRAGSSCLETIQRFARARGFSKHVAKQSALARRASSRADYQALWSIYHQWCHSHGHSVSRPSLPKIADFFVFYSARPRSFRFLPFFGISQCYRLCFVQCCLISPLLRFFRIC